MDSERKLTWLRWVLFVKTLITILVWGLPSLVGPLSLLAVLGVPIPEDPILPRPGSGGGMDGAGEDASNRAHLRAAQIQI